MKQSLKSRLGTHFLLLLGVALIIVPLYVTIITAFKTQAENAVSFFAWPKSLYLGNFQEILGRPAYFQALKNTLYVTVLTLAGEVVIMPAMSYAVGRGMGTSRVYRFIYAYLLIGIFIPFQVRMMPIAKIMSGLGLMNPTGLVILTIATATCGTVFLYVGYMGAVPAEMEEAAYIDGASTLQTYTRVVFPLLKPVTITVLIRDGLWAWNDFQMPLIVLNRKWEHWTLTLFQYNFKTEFVVDYSMVFTTLVLSMLPILLFYIVMQKQIIGGMTSGAVKG